MGHADHDQPAARRQVAWGHVIGSGGSDRDKYRVGAAPGGLSRGAPGFGIGGEHAVGGAEFARGGEFFLSHIDGDDARSAGDPGTLDGVQSDPAGTDDDDDLTGAHICGVDDCADAGGDAARQQAGRGHRHVVGNRCDLGLVNDDLFGEGTDRQALFKAAAARGGQRTFGAIIGGSAV